MIDEIIQLLTGPDKRTGLVVFTSYESYHTWLVQHCIVISRAQCHYRAVDMYWQHEQTPYSKLQLVIINTDKDLFKLAGYLFDKVWFADKLTDRRRKVILGRVRGTHHDV